MPVNSLGESSEREKRSLKALTKLISSATASYKCMFDEDWLTVQFRSEAVWNETVRLKFRHIPSKVITRITKDNLEYCSRLMRCVELRHLENVRGYLGIRDNGSQFLYLSGSRRSVNEKRSGIIVSHNESFVQTQEYFFDRVWNLATPALQRIAEIRRESVDGTTETTITEKKEIESSLFAIINSSKSEVLAVFPYSNVFCALDRLGPVAALGNKIKDNVVVRAVVHIDDKNDKNGAEYSKQRIRHALRQQNNELYANIAFLRKEAKQSNMFFVIDQASMLSVEIVDRTKEDYPNIVGRATLSNSETQVSVGTSIFDTLWIQSELEKQQDAKNAYFRIFKGFKLKEEEYRRNWSSSSSSSLQHRKRGRSRNPRIDPSTHSIISDYRTDHARRKDDK